MTFCILLRRFFMFYAKGNSPWYHLKETKRESCVYSGIIGELNQRRFWATLVKRKWGLFHFKAPWRYQICLSSKFFTIIETICPDIWEKPQSKNETKKITSAWCASLKKRLCSIRLTLGSYATQATYFIDKSIVIFWVRRCDVVEFAREPHRYNHTIWQTAQV